jgi:hypothetical protein
MIIVRERGVVKHLQGASLAYGVRAAKRRAVSRAAGRRRERAGRGLATTTANCEAPPTGGGMGVGSEGAGRLPQADGMALGDRSLRRKTNPG